MTGRGVGAGLGWSPLEVAGIALAVAVTVGVGMLWAVGVVVGSVLGSTLPGTGGEGVLAMLRSFPNIGQAWEPPISSTLVWAVAAVVVAVFGPPLRRLMRSGRLAQEGAQWATTSDLRHAGLLVPDQPLSHAEPEEPPDAT